MSMGGCNTSHSATAYSGWLDGLLGNVGWNFEYERNGDWGFRGIPNLLILVWISLCLCSFLRKWSLYEKPYKTYPYGSTRANVVEEYSLAKTDLWCSDITISLSLPNQECHQDRSTLLTKRTRAGRTRDVLPAGMSAGIPTSPSLFALETLPSFYKSIWN